MEELTPQSQRLNKKSVLNDELHTSKVFYADYPYQSRFKVILAVSLLPYILPTIIVPLLMEEQGIRITPLLVILDLILLVAMFVSSLCLVDKYHVLTAADYHILICDETGILWRVHSVIWDPSHFRKTPLGKMMGEGAIGDTTHIGYSSYRAYLLSRQAPPNASRLLRWESVQSIVALTDLKVYKETNVSWKITFLHTDGKRRKLVIPKAYPNFVPRYPYTSYEETVSFTLPLDLILTPAMIGGIGFFAMLFASGLISF